MRAIVAIAAILPVVVGGCSGTIDVDLSTADEIDRYEGTALALNVNRSGDATRVDARSLNAERVTVELWENDRRVTDARVSVGDSSSAIDVPDSGIMEVDADTQDQRVPNARNEDSFLVQLDQGRDFEIAQYGTDTRNRSIDTYFVAGEETENMPTSGSARYVGNAYGTMFSTTRGRMQMTGAFRGEASFTPGRSEFEGRIRNVEGNGSALGFDIVLQTSNGGDGFAGSIGLENTLTRDPVGDVRGASGYSGSFYGHRARGAAGVFQLEAWDVPGPRGGRHDIEAVGAFGGQQ